MNYLSKETFEWLKQRDYVGFVEYFIGMGTDKPDIKYRKASIEIASQWCILHEAGGDNKTLHSNIRSLILPHIKKSASKDYEDATPLFWSEMCANCAVYRFAKIDEFDLTRALYGIYRTLLPKERDIEPFDQMILEKLAEAKRISLSLDKQFGYGIRTNGLDSEVVIPAPEDTRAWTQYADQYRIVLINQ